MSIALRADLLPGNFWAAATTKWFPQAEADNVLQLEKWVQGTRL